MLGGVAIQALLIKTTGPHEVVQVMALWAMAWAGSKSIAPLADGWLASSVGVHLAGQIVTLPAITLAIIEIFLPQSAKNIIKSRA